MSDHRSRMRKLALAYEELSTHERVEVDAYLENDPALRQELSRLQKIEAMARSPLGSEASPSAAIELSDAELAQERASRERLLQEVRAMQSIERARAAQSAASTQRSGRLEELLRPRFVRWMPVVAAAASVLFFFGPWSSRQSTSDLVISDLQVVAVDVGGSVQRSASPGFVDGDTFALGFLLNEDASIVVYHVDPVGEVALAYPTDSGEALPRVNAGSSVQIPSASEAESWVFVGTPGTETFIVAATSQDDVDLRVVDAMIREEVAKLTGRRSRSLRLEQILRAELGTTSVVEVEHRE